MSRWKKIIKSTPFIGTFAQRWYRNLAFPGSRAYWEARYAEGGTSGSGSFGRLAEFKARILNAFVVEQGIGSVIEFGCGDGNQLSLAKYPAYVGLDVSRSALRRCRERFGSDSSKSFFLYDPDAFVDHAGVFRADAALSIDVLFHLVEEAVFEAYLGNLFDSSTRFVVIYSSDREQTATGHERHRNFTSWVITHRPQWALMKRLPNQFPFDLADPDHTSNSEFFFFARR
jgi:hypothetical protein